MNTTANHFPRPGETTSDAVEWNVFAALTADLASYRARRSMDVVPDEEVEPAAA